MENKLKDTEATWIPFKNLDEEDFDLVCSNCMCSALIDYFGKPAASKFCPHCGKKMSSFEKGKTIAIPESLRWTNEEDD